MLQTTISNVDMYTKLVFSKDFFKKRYTFDSKIKSIPSIDIVNKIGKMMKLMYFIFKKYLFLLLSLGKFE